MVKVGFWFDAPIEYSGGLNYIKNLLYALSLVNDGSVRPFIFFAADITPDIQAQFAAHAVVVKTKLLQRRTAPWFVHKILYKVFGSMLLANTLLKRHGITVLSHVWFEYKGHCPFRIIGWIPDFQYLHLPELFPTLDPDAETSRNRRIIAQSQIVILSSHDALKDFRSIAPPETRSRAIVLQFVSQPGVATSSPLTALDAIEQKYGFHGKYFVLPNQFWAHKNHMVVLRAVKLLKDQNVSVLVLCTGNTRDYRVAGSGSTKYIDAIYDFIGANGLEANVKILGHIDYGEVLTLMRNAVAVLNPSRFEGWSSSVEEAKSMGKPVILSRIAVHVEQKPRDGTYFDPDDAVGLAQVLGAAWAAPQNRPYEEAAQIARIALQERTVEFGTAYLGLLKSVIHKLDEPVQARAGEPLR